MNIREVFQGFCRYELQKWRKKQTQNKTKHPYPVDNEDLADAELVLELLGSYGHRVEVAETPAEAADFTLTCVRGAGKS